MRDLLSPYLFLLCSEGLSSLLRSRACSGLLKGAKISRGVPTVTHLLFADDCLIFDDATLAGALIIRDILSQYSTASGQLINFDKSGVFFSSNVGNRNRNEVCATLGVGSSTNLEKYLGLPSVIGRNKRAAFVDIHGKLIKRSSGLSSRMLFASGKEVSSAYLSYKSIANQFMHQMLSNLKTTMNLKQINFTLELRKTSDAFPNSPRNISKP
ncbi:hypothetical protein V6N13_139832 [Hibiscus sabdariffa]